MMFENFDWVGAVRNSPVMLILMGCSVVTFGFAIERAWAFWRARGNPEHMMSRALELLRAGNVREAVWTCRTSPHPFGAVAADVMRGAHLPPDAQEEKLHISLSEVRMRLERNLGWLGTMGNTAPLIGLLGTVWGIMRAFHDMANTGSAGPSVVAAGVAEALLTTGAGLVVAVPAVMLYNHFARRISVVLTVTENHARTLRMSMSDLDVRSDDDSAGHGAPRESHEPIAVPQNAAVARAA